VVLVLSGSLQTQWDSELLAALGAQLGVDLTQKVSQDGHLDVLGPYDVKLDDKQVTLAICEMGLDSFMGLQNQSDLGVEASAWIARQKPKVAWLDGDRAQFFVGRELAAKTPIVFSGVVSDRQAYYGANATGVYERPALSALLKLIWDRAPKAQRFALISDASPVSRGSLAKFNELLTVAIGKGDSVIPMEPAEDWTQLRQRLADAQKKSDAVILAGIGEEQGGEGFKPPCPEGLMNGISVPVVAVGTNDAATCFPVNVRLRPSAHVKVAVGMVSQVLEGADPGGIPTITPEDMQVTVNE
jgi:hypothetical protein